MQNRNRMRQRAWCCTVCGAGEFYLRDLCKACYQAWKRNSSRFGGLREKALARDRHCLLCTELALRRLVVHHRKPGVNALETFATLCRAHHCQIHLRKRLRYALPAKFKALWREQHPQQAEQLEFPFAVESRAEQLRMLH